MSESNEVLFVRTDEDDDETEAWDDTALIQAYDKAVNLAKEEVAKRIARDTQGQQSQSSKHQTKKPSKQKWTVGAPCRALYSEDEKTYEAIIIKIYENSGECIVRYVGYDNTEKVELDSLMESNGLESQIAQQKEALKYKAYETYNTPFFALNYPTAQNSKHINNEKMDCDTQGSRSFKSNLMPKPPFNIPFNGIPAPPFNGVPPPPFNEVLPPPFNGIPFNGIPFNGVPSPSFNGVPPSSSFNRIPSSPPFNGAPPPPPLPPQLMAKLPENETDALSSMLMSWYISGFHTGYYHGIKQGSTNQNRKSC